ncbi:MAG: N-acetyl sugar amidotransferase, partial [Candidatus Sungbacteria bacterium]|nr:N-acetyl sugar amidotransferase [Candidatus Sungbacteria bacterium]
MKYCNRCIIPDTRPGIRINASGVCSACLAHDAKAKIDWPQRREEFKAIAESAKKRGRGYDCVIPVSGGKDSTWQVVTCLGYGLHPLAVTWKPPARTDLGRKNLENLVNLGVDHIDFQINPEVEKKF